MRSHLIVLAVACLLVTAVWSNLATADTIRAATEEDMLTLQSESLTVVYDGKTGKLTIRHGDREFLTEARLVAADAQEGANARIVPRRDALGTGKAIEVTWPDGRIRRLALYESLPFVCIQAGVQNTTDRPITIDQIAAFEATADLGLPTDQLRAFGPEGLFPLKKRDTFCFAAVVDPASRNGVVCGWLSHFRGSGVVSIDTENGSLRLGARCEYGRLLVPPGETAEGETVAIGYFDDALAGLEAYADGCAKAHQIKLPEKVPSGYCTWYHSGASNQKQLAELADFAGKKLKQFGFDFVQIDDGWQIGRRDFTAHNPRGRYSDGMKPMAEKITAAGMTAGIWYIPFGWDPKCAALADHADWFVKRPDGSIYTVKWAGSCLDMTHPDARAFLREVVARMSKEWGYKYIKIDGLWTGMALKILYPSPTYRPDDMGQAVFHDPSKTHVEAYRSGLELVREAAGDDVFILGCNIAQNVRTLGGSFGLVDGMRIGHDIGARWGSIRGCALPTSHFYFFHTKVWFNDPDCLMLRDPLTVDQARAWGSLLAISGQMNVVSEFLPGLPAEKLDVVKRTMPNHNGLGRPIDLFENTLPTIWHYEGTLGEEPIHIVGLFNWDEKNASTVEFDPARLGLPSSAEDRYVGFDFWENRFVAPFSGKQAFELRRSSCRVLAIHPACDRPQLVGTSRHVTQGAIDISKVTWIDPPKQSLRNGPDAGHGKLQGRSEVVGGDPYELRIFAPQLAKSRFKAIKVGISPGTGQHGAQSKMRQEGPEVRVTIDSPTSGTIDWLIHFEKLD